MSRLTIEIDTPENEELLLALLPKLGSRVVTNDGSANDPAHNKAFIEMGRYIANQGGLSSFGDASEWQREVRSWDRVLVGREE